MLAEFLSIKEEEEEYQLSVREIKPAKGNDQRTDLLNSQLNSLYVFIKLNKILQLPICLFKQSPLTLTFSSGYSSFSYRLTHLWEKNIKVTVN